MTFPKARLIGGLPYGDSGDNAWVRKGRMESLSMPVALKISKSEGYENELSLSKELEKSEAISSLLPNTAAYYGMVKLANWLPYPHLQWNS